MFTEAHVCLFNYNYIKRKKRIFKYKTITDEVDSKSVDGRPDLENDCWITVVVVVASQSSVAAADVVVTVSAVAVGCTLGLS